MTTQDIANKLVEMMKKGEYDAAYDTLFSPDFIGIWPAGSPEEKPCVWIIAMKEKGKMRADSMDKFLWSRVSEPVVWGNFFSIAMWFTCVYKGTDKETSEQEIIVYQVKDGKIVKEQYFYDVE